MNEQKPCPITKAEAANAADVLMQIAPQNLQQVKALSAANKVLLWVVLFHQAAPENKQNWLPVSEPPETETPVFICATRKLCDGGEAQIRSLAMYEDGKMTTDNSTFEWNNEDFEYDEKSDSFVIPEGWWEYPVYSEYFSPVDDFITHWMPLPAPPNTRKTERRKYETL